MQNQLIDLLTLHIPFDQEEENYRKITLNFIANTKDCTNRQSPDGHITASAWVLSPNRTAALLIHHKKLNRWLQLGGHVENDQSIQDAACREAQEESGIIDLQLIDKGLFDIDIHLIPARKNYPSHYHYDCRFIFQSTTLRFVVNDESHNLAWVSIAEITEEVADKSIIRMARKTQPFLDQIRAR